jgi:hypothetical protein
LISKATPRQLENLIAMGFTAGPCSSMASTGQGCVLSVVVLGGEQLHGGVDCGRCAIVPTIFVGSYLCASIMHPYGADGSVYTRVIKIYKHKVSGRLF